MKGTSNQQPEEKRKKATKKQINHNAALIAPRFKDLYAKEPEKAVEELKKLLKQRLNSIPDLYYDEEEDIDIFIAELLSIEAEWSSKEDLLFLYTRWAKIVSSHFHTPDANAVMSPCLPPSAFEINGPSSVPLCANGKKACRKSRICS